MGELQLHSARGPSILKKQSNFCRQNPFALSRISVFIFLVQDLLSRLAESVARDRLKIDNR